MGSYIPNSAQERQAMLDRTEKDCEALRAAAMARMDDAVDYLLKKVVKR